MKSWQVSASTLPDMVKPSALLKWFLGDNIEGVSFVEVPPNTPYIYKSPKTKLPKVEPEPELRGWTTDSPLEGA